MIKLLVREISDRIIRENFQRLEFALKGEPLLKGKFKFFEITFDSAVTNLKYKHGLGFIPKDVLQTSVTGSGSVTWNFSKFDREYLDITTTAACTVRAFIGSYREASE